MTGEREVALLASDLDGTLLRSDNTVAPATRTALKLAADAGLQVVFVTGRPTRWLWEVADATGYAGVVVAGNGALLLPQEVITLPRDEQIILIESFPPIKTKTKPEVPKALFISPI